MEELERKWRFTASASAAVVSILGQVLSRVALIEPQFEAAIREGLEAAAENLALQSREPVESSQALDLEHQLRITRLLTLWALSECDIRARVARGENLWCPRPGAARGKRDT